MTIADQEILRVGQVCNAARLEASPTQNLHRLNNSILAGRDAFGVSDELGMKCDDCRNCIPSQTASSALPVGRESDSEARSVEVPADWGLVWVPSQLCIYAIAAFFGCLLFFQTLTKLQPQALFLHCAEIKVWVKTKL